MFKSPGGRGRGPPDVGAEPGWGPGEAQAREAGTWGSVLKDVNGLSFVKNSAAFYLFPKLDAKKFNTPNISRPRPLADARRPHYTSL